MSASNLKTNVKFTKDSILFKEGDPGGDIIIIQSGQVEVFQVRNGQEWVLATMDKGEILGVMTALSQEPRSASARALTDITGILIPKEQISEVFKNFPMWGKTIVTDLISRVKNGNEIFIEKSMAAEGKLTDDPLALAVMVSSCLGPLLKMMTAGGVAVTFKDLTKQVSEVLGVEEKEIESIFTVFEQEKLLESTGKTPTDRSFQISSVKRLKAFAEFVKTIKRLVKEQETAASILAVGERATLLQMAESVETQNPDAIGEFSRGVFSKILQKHGDEMAIQITLNRAEKLGYLKQNKEGEVTKLKFSPTTLLCTMRFYSVMKRLSPHAFVCKNLQKAIVM